jgi:signal transduction histidine kinase
MTVDGPAAPKPHILLVDDRPDSLAALETALATLGYDHATARSAEEALREILRRDLALIVLAGARAPEIVRRVRQHPRSRLTPILVVAGARDAALAKCGDGVAPIDVLPRPIDQRLLRAKASVLVDLYGKTKRIKTLERSLRQREREARKAIIVRDEFLSVASHELRTPLTSLKLEVANLLRLVRRGDAGADDRLVPRVERIDAQTERLHRLIDELLDASRITAGHLELEIEEVDLGAVVTEVVRRHEHETARAGSVVDLRVPAAGATGSWDADRLDQVASNLIANAIKYGDGKPIEIVVAVTDERASLAVTDHGVGIAPDDQERIFDRFERAVSSRNYGGVGLGLWSVRQIVEALDGTVSVESRPGLGATFTVELPRARREVAAAALAVGGEPDKLPPGAQTGEQPIVTAPVDPLVGESAARS